MNDPERKARYIEVGLLRNLREIPEMWVKVPNICGGVDELPLHSIGRDAADEMERLMRENARYKSALQHIAGGGACDPWHAANEALAPSRLA